MPKDFSHQSSPPRLVCGPYEDAEILHPDRNYVELCLQRSSEQIGCPIPFEIGAFPVGGKMLYGLGEPIALGDGGLAAKRVGRRVKYSLANNQRSVKAYLWHDRFFLSEEERRKAKNG